MWMWILLGILLVSSILDWIVDYLNLKSLRFEVPQEFVDLYSKEKYEKSQQYLKENTKFSSMQSFVSLVVILSFLLSGGFNSLDQLALKWSSHPIWQGLIYIGFISGLAWFLNLPFQIYHTFVIEEKYGFNKTSFATFAKDQVLGIVLMAIIGGPVLALLLWFFLSTGEMAWLYAWLAFTSIQLFLTFLAPVVIMPLFNKFTPLPDSELRREIENFANQENFQLNGIFSMDGSKRSSKANAFFTGFGKYKRIVLFDTLIEKHSTDELVAVLAHEMGHFKKGHIFKMIAISVLSTGFMFYVLSLFLSNEQILADLGMQRFTIHAALVFFSILYSPLSQLLNLFYLYLSRKHEFEADAYAAQSYKKPESLIVALKKLSVENLSNLNPHRWKVILNYTHPPILERISALRKQRT